MKSEIVMGDDRLEMTRFFPYPRAAVFEAWTQPEQVEKWWGCKDTSSVKSTIDLREGGEYSHIMTIHGNEMTYAGVYTEIVVPERLVSETSFGPDMKSKVTIEFLEKDGGTEGLMFLLLRSFSSEVLQG